MTNINVVIVKLPGRPGASFARCDGDTRLEVKDLRVLTFGTSPENESVEYDADPIHAPFVEDVNGRFWQLLAANRTISIEDFDKMISAELTGNAKIEIVDTSMMDVPIACAIRPSDEATEATDVLNVYPISFMLMFNMDSSLSALMDNYLSSGPIYSKYNDQVLSWMCTDPYNATVCVELLKLVDASLAKNIPRLADICWKIMASCIRTFGVHDGYKYCMDIKFMEKTFANPLVADTLLRRIRPNAPTELMHTTEKIIAGYITGIYQLETELTYEHIQWGFFELLMLTVVPAHCRNSRILTLGIKKICEFMSCEPTNNKRMLEKCFDAYQRIAGKFGAVENFIDTLGMACGATEKTDISEIVFQTQTKKHALEKGDTTNTEPPNKRPRVDSVGTVSSADPRTILSAALTHDDASNVLGVDSDVDPVAKIVQQAEEKREREAKEAREYEAAVVREREAKEARKRKAETARVLSRMSLNLVDAIKSNKETYKERKAREANEFNKRLDNGSRIKMSVSIEDFMTDVNLRDFVSNKPITRSKFDAATAAPSHGKSLHDLQTNRAPDNLIGRDLLIAQVYRAQQLCATAIANHPDKCEAFWKQLQAMEDEIHKLRVEEITPVEAEKMNNVATFEELLDTGVFNEQTKQCLQNMYHLLTANPLFPNVLEVQMPDGLPDALLKARAFVFDCIFMAKFPGRSITHDEILLYESFPLEKALRITPSMLKFSPETLHLVKTEALQDDIIFSNCSPRAYMRLRESMQCEDLLDQCERRHALPFLLAECGSSLLGQMLPDGALKIMTMICGRYLQHECFYKSYNTMHEETVDAAQNDIASAMRLFEFVIDDLVKLPASELQYISAGSMRLMLAKAVQKHTSKPDLTASRVFAQLAQNVEQTNLIVCECAQFVQTGPLYYDGIDKFSGELDSRKCPFADNKTDAKARQMWMFWVSLWEMTTEATEAAGVDIDATSSEFIQTMCDIFKGYTAKTKATKKTTQRDILDRVKPAVLDFFEKTLPNHVIYHLSDEKQPLSTRKKIFRGAWAEFRDAFVTVLYNDSPHSYQINLLVYDEDFTAENIQYHGINSPVKVCYDIVAICELLARPAYAWNYGSNTRLDELGSTHRSDHSNTVTLPIVERELYDAMIEENEEKIQECKETICKWCLVSIEHFHEMQMHIRQVLRFSGEDCSWVYDFFLSTRHSRKPGDDATATDDASAIARIRENFKDDPRIDSRVTRPWDESLIEKRDRPLPDGNGSYFQSTIGLHVPIVDLTAKKFWGFLIQMVEKQPAIWPFKMVRKPCIGNIFALPDLDVEYTGTISPKMQRFVQDTMDHIDMEIRARKKRPIEVDNGAATATATVPAMGVESTAAPLLASNEIATE